MRSPAKKRHLVLAAAVLSLGCGDAPAGPAVTDNILSSGESILIAGAQNSQRVYRIEVPAGTGTLQLLLSGGSGDADLVIRHGAAPETGLYDCVSETDGNEEECLIDAPQAGIWYVMVLGYTNYSSVRLLGNLGATSGAVAISTGVPVPDLAGGAGSFQMFSILVPGGATSLAVTLDGPNGDADLYIRQGSFPLLNQYDQASFDEGSAESVLQSNPAVGNWFIRVEGFDAFTGATLTATVTIAPAVVAAR
jgi:hypothetical protein